MKRLLPLLFCFLTLSLRSQTPQEIEIKTTVNEVTVYLTGAQVSRTTTVDIPAGRSMLKFVNLSPFVDSKSISVKAKGDFTVLSVNFQQNFLAQQSKSKEAAGLEKNKLDIESKIKTETAYFEALNEELAFLKANSSIGGANTGTSLSSLKEADTYFTEKITSIKIKQIDRQNTIDQLNKELEKTENQLAQLISKKELPSGEIIVSAEAANPVKTAFEVKYIVSNAGWTPAYDIRVKNIDLPADLVYKANVHQSTNEEWKNIKLKLSSSDPNSSTSYRELQPYFLNYYTAPPSYQNTYNQVNGHVFDKTTKEALPGATVMIKGSSIGTITDISGFYSLPVPGKGGILSVSYIGYKQAEAPISGQQIDFSLEEDVVALQEVVVTGYGGSVNDLTGRVSGISTSGRKAARSQAAAGSSMVVATEQVSNQTSVEFEIKTPYTIPSDGRNLAINIDEYSLPASYQYYCTPKIDQNAWLLARIVDWEKYNLLEGEANVFFEDTFTGKTLLDVRYMSDTLTISLGKDKGVTIKRELQKQLTTRQFLGNKKEETRSWLISVKNNKSQAVNLVLSDQIPVSTMEEIEVTPLDISNGKPDAETGKIKWEFQLKPAEKKELSLKYSVKYPKFRSLVIE